MTREKFERLSGLLKQELVPALGCTEPISIALACAKAREVLGAAPQRVELFCSGNIIKNAKSVLVPNSGGRHGIAVAAALGAVAGVSERSLQVLEEVTGEQQEAAADLAISGAIRVHLAEDRDPLYICAQVTAGEDWAAVELRGSHTVFSSVTRNGRVLQRAEPVNCEMDTRLSGLDLWDMLDYGKTLEERPDETVYELLRRQAACNSAVAREGLRGSYGMQVGRTILESEDLTRLGTLAKARAAAGSDARMDGCNMPVVINSGSGNQGLTVSLPVITYAEHLHAEETTMLCALAVANLVALYQKYFIGKLSAFCGAVSAAAGAGAGLGYLLGLSREQIAGIITNTLAGAGGILCDGAKASCALKIAVALENMLLAVELCQKGHVLAPGSGIVGQDADETIRHIGRIACDGLRMADREILSLMTSSTG